MIVKMQKVTLLVTEKTLTDAIGKVRGLGVVHVQHIQQPQAEGITSLEHRLARVDKVLKIIGDKEAEPRQLKEAEVRSCIKEILSLDKARANLTARLLELYQREAWYKEWGDISAHTLKPLRDAGVFIKLYVCSKAALKKIPQDALVYIVKEKAQEVLCALVTTDEKDSLPGQEVSIPSGNLYHLHKKINHTKGALKTVTMRFDTLCGCKESFVKCREELRKRLEFYNVRFGMKHEEGFSYLRGYCPRESLSSLFGLAEKEGWGIVSSIPDNPQEVPTLIRTPWWLRIIDPVFKFMGTVPGYNEFDISFWFLLFFSLFFAMLIGDAGYGFVFLVLTFLTRKKLKHVPREPFVLMYVLSCATILWGAITGTWFGYERIAQLPFLSALVIPRIASFGVDNQEFLMYFCFLIGAIHLSIAHGLIAVRVCNSLRVLSQVGWISILWGLFFVAGTLVLRRPFPSFATPLLVAGAGLVLLFSSPQKNIAKGILVSLGNLPLNVISSFSDIVSYLRLFAVGYATVIVAVSFNDMAKGFFAALILFAGHTLNIILGLMSIIVHGIRLNMLEFSGHLSMQWSGTPYAPFRE